MGENDVTGIDTRLWAASFAISLKIQYLVSSANVHIPWYVIMLQHLGAVRTSTRRATSIESELKEIADGGCAIKSELCHHCLSIAQAFACN